MMDPKSRIHMSRISREYVMPHSKSEYDGNKSSCLKCVNVFLPTPSFRHSNAFYGKLEE